MLNHIIRQVELENTTLVLKIKLGFYVIEFANEELSYDIQTHTLQEVNKKFQEILNNNAENIIAKQPPIQGLGYVSQKLIPSDASRISKKLKNIGLKNRYSSKHYHFTLQYDKRNPIIDYNEMERDRFLSAKPVRIEILGADSPVPALAIIFESQELQERFTELKELGFEYDYDPYLPHITVKYRPDEGDLALLQDNIEELFETIGTIQSGFEVWRKAKV